ncbi:hypothetical protein [Vibrio sp. SCSIO 43137]|nr:hypothetical protein [Vibrio sp. SCSIO 43137]WCE31676.1 hypothetical protein PK654_21350 [Vibrio sp. SCSIO 43137]
MKLILLLSAALFLAGCCNGYGPRASAEPVNQQALPAEEVISA